MKNTGKKIPFIHRIKDYPTNKQSLNYFGVESLKKESFFIFLKKNSFINKKQIESCKKIINRKIKKKKKKRRYEVFVNYNLIRTKKPIGSRMGKGKGKVSEHVAVLKKNEILFRFHDISPILASIICKKIRYKLPIKIDSSKSRINNIFV